MPSWRLGQRDLATATDFVNDLAKRVRGRVQITTDALKTYVNVIEDACGSECDFAQLREKVTELVLARATTGRL